MTDEKEARTTHIARDKYWECARWLAQNNNLSKTITIRDLEEIFNKLVIPVIDVIRKADREQSAEADKEPEENKRNTNYGGDSGEFHT